MGKFTIGDKFESIQEYENYPYTHLYFHHRLIGKAITDNWQFRMISNSIKRGDFSKVKLNTGYNLYEVSLLIEEWEIQTKDLIVEKSQDIAIAKAVCKYAEMLGFSKREVTIKSNIKEIPQI